MTVKATNNRVAMNPSDTITSDQQTTTFKIQHLLGKGFVRSVYLAKSPSGPVAVSCITTTDAKGMNKELAVLRASLGLNGGNAVVSRYILLDSLFHPASLIRTSSGKVQAVFFQTSRLFQGSLEKLNTALQSAIDKQTCSYSIQWQNVTTDPVDQSSLEQALIHNKNQVNTCLLGPGGVLYHLAEKLDGKVSHGDLHDGNVFVNIDPKTMKITDVVVADWDPSKKANIENDIEDGLEIVESTPLHQSSQAYAESVESSKLFDDPEDDSPTASILFSFQVIHDACSAALAWTQQHLTHPSEQIDLFA